MGFLRFLFDLLLLPIRFALLLGLIGGTFYLYELAKSPWALGLPVYMSPIFWWLSWRRIDRDFDPVDWNGACETKQGNFLHAAAIYTTFLGSFSSAALAANDGPFHWGVPAGFFVAFFILVANAMRLRDRRRQKLHDHFRPNERAQRVWQIITIIGFLLMVTSELPFGILAEVLIVPGAILFSVAILASMYLDMNPKKIN